MAKYPRLSKNIDRNIALRNLMIELCKADRVNFTKTKLVELIGHPAVIDKYFMGVLREVEQY